MLFLYCRERKFFVTDTMRCTKACFSRRLFANLRGLTAFVVPFVKNVKKTAFISWAEYGIMDIIYWGGKEKG